MIRAFRFAAFCGCLGLGAFAYAQEPNCDMPVNEGELNCLYEQVQGESSRCPDEPDVSCPAGSLCGSEMIPVLQFRYYCFKDFDEIPFGKVMVDNTSTAPKWKGPGPGQTGKTAMIVSAVVCQNLNRCECELNRENNLQYCISRPKCGDSVLWTLAKNPDPTEICIACGE